MQQEVSVQVEVNTGRLQGSLKNAIAEFRGVPYAAAPIGDLRLAPPQPAPTWAGVRSATENGPIAPQTSSRVYASMGQFEAAQAEDCLSLTIWAPWDGTLDRPVVVWLHGGGFMTGAGSAPWYDGAVLAQTVGAVVVNVNYRLGALGFLSLPGVVDGNLAVLDQAAALRWVHANIGAFGGSPQRVTVVGQSGGGHNIASLLAMPDTDGLFARAFLMSAPLGIDLHAAQDSARTASTFIEFCGIASARVDLAAALRSLPLATILSAQDNTARALGRMADGDLRPPFMPCAEPARNHPRTTLIEVASHAAATRGVELLISWTRDEANLFYFGQPTLFDFDAAQLRQAVAQLPYGLTDGLLDEVRQRRPDGSNRQWFMDAVADITFRLPSQQLASAVVANGGRAFVHQFDWSSAQAELGACHCIDIPFYFDTFEHWVNAPLFAGAQAASYRPVCRQAMSMLTGFVQDGAPGLAPWNPAARTVQHLG